MEEERFWEEESRRRFEAEFFEWGPSRMGPPRGPPGPMGPRPLMEGVGDMGPVGTSCLLFSVATIGFEMHVQNTIDVILDKSDIY